MSDIESATGFYLGHEVDLLLGRALHDRVVQYPARDLTTHAVVVGMTGSGKTGLCVDILEEAALDGVPAIVIDPKGDIANVLLQFPELRPEDFRPWIDASGAAGEQSPEQLAAAEAERWRAGLAAAGMSPERIRALGERAEFALYTPGSDAGRPVSVLQTLRAPLPDEWQQDAEGVRARIGATVAALLGLIGVEADPVRSREHILLSNLFEEAWRAGRDLDLAGLIQQIHRPPFERLGAFEVETFFPEKERFALAMQLNGLIAAPAFRSWLEGAALDVDALLRSPAGKPRVSLFYLAHLSEAERMFFITLLLGQVHAWLHRQSGATGLRALLYFDEIFGYLPPHPANPASKAPLLRLLKEARAYGLGLLLVTQNPVDLDYKGLTNAGTWFIGKLQTERDKQRVLDGLEGAATAAQQGVSRAELDRLIATLGPRQFLLHNVHANGPRVFQTRWALSYLRGPLTRAELRRLPQAQAAQAAPAPATPAAAAITQPAQPAQPAPAAGAPGRVAGAAGAAGAARAARGAGPAFSGAVLPSEIRQYFLPVRYAPDHALRRWTQTQARALPLDALDGARLRYAPALLAQGLVRFFDRKAGVNEEHVATCLVREAQERGLIRWEDAHLAPLDPAALGQTPFERDAPLDPVPALLANPRRLAALEKDFAGYLYRSVALSLWHNPALKAYSAPGQSEHAFRAHCEALAREQRDADGARAGARLDTRIETLRARREGELRRREALEAEVDARANEQTWTNLESVWDAVTKRRMRRPISTAQRAARLTEQARHDLEASAGKIAALDQQIADLEAERAAARQAHGDRWAAAAQQIQPLQITPKKSDIHVEIFGIGWLPVWTVAAGDVTMALPAFGD